MKIMNIYINNMSLMWLNMGLVEQRNLKLAVGARNLSTMKVRIKQNIDLKPKSWHYINWKEAEVKVKDLQEKIVIATLDNDFKEVYRLQWILINCFEAKALAVRRVITNKGGKTSGVDKIVWNNPDKYWKAIEDLSEVVKDPASYQAKPVRRVYIPKGNSKEMRPLGIPTMFDRTVQALYHLGVEPVVETRSDPNSFGFRKNRSTHDAITAIRSHLDKNTHPHWILEADIRKCFDRIDHEFLMKHTPICHKMVLKQWLKSGIMEELNYIAIDEGTPQGGIMSPTLCNVALNGIEGLIKKENPLKKGISPGVHVIRYADDMIITSKTKEIAIKNKKILSEFLIERGLELNENKTLLTHIKTGFDFLGFNIKRVPWNPKFNQKTDQETVLIIKPSEKGVNKLKDTMRKILVKDKPLSRIISEANPVLRGWGEHKRISYHSQETFIKMDHWIQTRMRQWAFWRKGSKRRNVNKFLIQTENRKWNWGLSLREKLINLAEIAIIKLRPLKLDRNPFIIENQKYFEERKIRLIDAKFRATIYRIYKQLCPNCGESLHNGEIVELHHIIPAKSKVKYSIENIVPLHQICHQQVTYGDQSLERFKRIKSEDIKPKKLRKRRTKMTETLKSKSIG